MRKKVVAIIIGMLLFAVILVPISTVSETIGRDDVLKWAQPPDETENGIDVRMDRSDGVERILADDFLCNKTGPIEIVVLWGAWGFNEPGDIEKFHLSIHSNIRAEDNPYGYSMPGGLLWESDVVEFDEVLDFTVTEGEWWFDPYHGVVIPPESASDVYKYTLYIHDEPFIQQGTEDDPIIYWLDVWVETTWGEFGWKCAEEHWEDAAVFNVTEEPGWINLEYPLPHPAHGQPIDLAFEIYTFEEPPVIFEPKIPDRFHILEIEAAILNLGDHTYHNISWSMSIDGGIWLPSSSVATNGTIGTIDPNQEALITSPKMIGFGSIEITIKVANEEPVTFNGFIFLFFIFTFSQ